MSTSKRFITWAFSGFLGAIIAGIIGWLNPIPIITPEIRQYLGLENQSNSTIAKNETVQQENLGSKNIVEKKQVETQNKEIVQVQNSTSTKISEQTDNKEFLGKWHGTWSSGEILYKATVELNENAGKVEGKIIWTLENTLNPNRISKIGTTAIEYVEGDFNKAMNSLNLFGNKKDDPNGIIRLDKYKLSFSSENQLLKGFSYGGKTKGDFSLTR